MKVIGVIDLRHGLAVHARGGRREHYAPVSGAIAGAPGDALGLARRYVRELGVPELYVADLDAIAAGPPQRAALRAIAAVGAPLWVDAAIVDDRTARAALDDGASRLVVGLETLTAFAALGAICGVAGGDRVAFSLDLRGGAPLRRADAPTDATTVELAERAAGAGASTVVVLDLARVGAGSGPAFQVLEAVRAALPTVTLVAGGGVRGRDDMRMLGEVGCDAALVATALHDGCLVAADVAEALAQALLDTNGRQRHRC